jgi:hypothetical protein
MRIVPFDEIRIVAVHSSDECGERGEKRQWDAAAEASGFLGEFEGEVGEQGAVAGSLGEVQGLHERVRYHDR